MVFKIALLLAFAAQLSAATLALRLNLRYRIYSAWFFVSAALLVGAILRLTTLFENWTTPPTFDENWIEWASAIVSLLSSILLLSGMSFIEPFFKEMAKAQAALRLEQQRLSSIVHETEEELRLAQRIQRQLLPSTVPELPNLDIYGRSDPAVWTSGDYFDYLTLRDGSTAMIVADVSGHGLGPALLMSSTRASFRGLAPTTSDIGELLTSGNRAVADSVADNDFVTAMVIRYSSDEHVLSYAGAGHVAYLMRSDGSWQTLEADSPPLGIQPDMKVEADCVTGVVSGDIVVVVTDGILEIRNAAGEMFGETSLMETARENAGKSARKIVEALMSASREFAGDQPQQDDVTAVVVKVI